MSLCLRKNVSYSALIVLLIIWLNVCSNSAQLTFSKGWKVGKRIEDDQDDQLKITTNTLCHFLLNQIREMIPCYTNPVSKRDIESILNNQL